jgi:hypothetical protein
VRAIKGVYELGRRVEELRVPTLGWGAVGVHEEVLRALVRELERRA